MRRPGMTLVATVSLIGLCLAAVPPRKAEELRTDATDIVLGEVRFVYAAEAKVEHGTDTRYCIEFAVTTVEKSPADKRATAPATAPAPKLIYARCWTPAKRPAGWAGPQGQNVVPKSGQRVRLYLTRGSDGGFDVLEPNGVELDKE